ncbi:MAG TPA: methionyl-tRNA formyltransferase [Ruminococcaceae bacterium]|nr:methionyl-tRNA formyltransferase [Oscillospiraceae bacterium]
MRIVFMGTPEFSVPCLERLVSDGEEVVGVFTQPDKPKGRGYEMAFSPVKECAIKHNIPVFQPKSMKTGEALEILKQLNPDLSIVVAYGKILPADVLYAPKYNSINIHASLLPRYRGSAPIQWCVINGEKESGVTSMLMDEGVDTGDMLIKDSVEITENMTAGELHDKLSELGAEVLSKTVRALKNGELKPVKQNDDESCYAPMLTKELCPVDFTKSAQVVHNSIRGLSPWPVATAVLDGKKVKIHSSVLSQFTSQAQAGEIVRADGALTVMCGDGKCVDITEIQLEGKKKMSVKDFLLGHKVEIGTIMERG